MTRLKVNIAANFIGQGWVALIQLAFIPIYLRLLGIEQYALIGFYLMLLASLQIFGLGISQAVNRELACTHGNQSDKRETRNLVRTLELIYWGIGILIGVMVFCTSPFIAKYWVNAEGISQEIVEQAVALIGIAIALQWPVSFYQGALLGLEKHLSLNILKIVASTITAVGALVVLWLVSTTITIFFAWHILANGIYALLSAMLLWKFIAYHDHKPRFSRACVKKVRHFIMGVAAISLISTFLTQADKLVVSAIVSLESYGYYILAGTIISSLLLIIMPFFNAIFPRFTILVNANDEAGLRTLYHKITQVMAVVIIPTVAVLALFSFDILLWWTNSPDSANNAANITTVLAIGTGINGLMTIPYAVQLAYGWTSIALRISTFLMILYIPMAVVFCLHYGAMGCAVAWLVLNILYMIMAIPLTHRRLLIGEGINWVIRDIGIPLIISVAIMLFCKAVVENLEQPLYRFINMTIGYIVAIGCSALATKYTREWFLSILAKRI